MRRSWMETKAGVAVSPSLKPSSTGVGVEPMLASSRSGFDAVEDWKATVALSTRRLAMSHSLRKKLPAVRSAFRSVNSTSFRTPEVPAKRMLELSAVCQSGERKRSHSTWHPSSPLRCRLTLARKSSPSTRDLFIICKMIQAKQSSKMATASRINHLRRFRLCST